MTTSSGPSTDNPKSSARTPTRRSLLIAGGAAVLTAAGVPSAAWLLRGRHHDGRHAPASPVSFVAALVSTDEPAPGSSPYGDAAKAVAFSPDGRTLAVGHDSGTVRLWDVANRRQVRTMMASRTIVCLAFSPDGRTLACGSGDDTSPPTHLWDLATGHRTDLPGSGWVTFSPDGHLLAVASGGDQVWLWDMSHRRKITTLHVADGTDFAAFSPDGKTLACGGGEPNSLTMQLWQVATRARKNTYVIPHGNKDLRVVGLSFDPAGRPLAIDDGDGVWDIAASERVATLRSAGPFGLGLSPAGLSPDGRTIVGLSGRSVEFVDISTGRVLASSNRGDSAISGWQVAFTKDSSLVAVTSGPQVLLYRLHRQG